MTKVFRVNHDKEALDAGVAALPLHTRRIEVERAGLPSVTDLPGKLGVDVSISRIEHKGRLYVPAEGDTIEVGDVVSVVGTEDEIPEAAKQIGTLLPGDPTHDGRLEFRRIFVSSDTEPPPTSGGRA